MSKLLSSMETEPERMCALPVPDSEVISITNDFAWNVPLIEGRVKRAVSVARPEIIP